MNIKPIKTMEDLAAVHKRIEEIWDAEAGTPEADELDILASLSCEYEQRVIHFPPITTEQYLAHINYHTDRLINILDLKFEDAYEQWDYRQKMKYFVQSMTNGEG